MSFITHFSNIKIHSPTVIITTAAGVTGITISIANRYTAVPRIILLFLHYFIVA